MLRLLSALCEMEGVTAFRGKRLAYGSQNSACEEEANRRSQVIASCKGLEHLAATIAITVKIPAGCFVKIDTLTRSGEATDSESQHSITVGQSLRANTA